MLLLFADNETVTVNGRFLQVPDTTNGEVKLCVSSESVANTDMTVVLAHQWDNTKKLLAYFLNATANCARAPDTGDYIFGVFTQNGDNILKAPATPPMISFATMPISEYCTEKFQEVQTVSQTLIQWIIHFVTGLSVVHLAR